MVLNLDSSLDLANRALPGALERYRAFLGEDIVLIDYFPLTPIPGKGYSARTAATLANPTVDANSIYNMNIVAFAPGDGTGMGNYRFGSFIFHSSFPLFGERERLSAFTPRKKEGILMEAAFPLFSICNGQVYANAVYLYQVGLLRDGRTLDVQSTLGGTSSQTFNFALNGEARLEPSIQLTTGYKKGSKFGDPHAIYYPSKDTNIRNDAFQVVGFLPFESSSSYLYQLVESKATPFGVR